MKLARVSAFFASLLAAAGFSFAGFGSTETFLPAVGRVPGQEGAQFYTTVWATNLASTPQTFKFELLKQGQANGSPASFTDSLAPDETKVYENVVETKPGLTNALGAGRITSSGEIFVSERIYDQAPGDDVAKTVGLFSPAFRRLSRSRPASPRRSRGSTRAARRTSDTTLRSSRRVVDRPRSTSRSSMGAGRCSGRRHSSFNPTSRSSPTSPTSGPGSQRRTRASRQP